MAQYFRLIADTLLAEIRGQNAPLLLAGVQYELPIFRSVCTYPYIGAEELHGNFDHASDFELYQQAKPLVAKLLNSATSVARDRYQQLAGTVKATDDLAAILTAAYHGRIDTLFLKQGAEVTGSYDTESESLTRVAGPHADDLLELAVSETLRTGGMVYALGPEAMPSSAPAAAVLRY
jgi:hypothetical protein